MRGPLVLVWLLLPVAVGAYHYGPGQDRVRLDQTQDLLAAAREATASGQHAEAADLFTQALAALPEDRARESRRIRLERAKAWLLAGQLPAAYNDLDPLVTELQNDPRADARLLADALSTRANAQYYLTWLMRLEGRPRQEWEPEIESARQTYRLLAEQAKSQSDAARAGRHKDDLEAAIRLARLDLSELQALPLPSQCKGCKSGQCNCKCKKPGKKPSKSKNKPKDARGASSGLPPDGSGN